MLARLPELVGRAREGMVMDCLFHQYLVIDHDSIGMAYSAFLTEDHPESVDGGVVGVGVVAARAPAVNRSQVRFIFLGP